MILKWYEANALQFSPQADQKKWRQYILAGILFLGIGVSLPLSEKIFPQKYQPVDQIEVLSRLMPSAIWQNSDLDSSCFQKTVLKNRLTVLQGRALYPRYYEAGGGEAFTDSFGYKIADEGRLVFQLLGQSNGRIVFPRSTPPDFFPNASDATLFFDASGNLWFILVEQGDVRRMYFSETLVPSGCD